MHEGTMIDGSFVEVPRQRNTREENKIIKEGQGGLQHPDKSGLKFCNNLSRPMFNISQI